MRYVQDAVPGNEDAGYAEALVGVDGEWRGIQVEAMPLEKAVIDHELSTPPAGDRGAGESVRPVSSEQVELTGPASESPEESVDR